MKSGLLAAVPAHNLIYNIVCDMKAINLNLETIQKYTQHYINKRSIIMKQQLRVFLTLLLCVVASVGWGQTSVTIWEEDWSTGKKNDLASAIHNPNATYSLGGTSDGNYATIYESNTAGGTSPELMIPKKSNKQTFISTINLDGAIGNLTLTFNSNQNISITSTKGVTITKISGSTSNKYWQYAVTVPDGANQLVLTFAMTTDYNARIDNIKLVPSVSVSISDAGLATFSSAKALDFTNCKAVSAYKAKVEGSQVTLTKVNVVPAETGVLLRSMEGRAVNADIPVATSADAIDDNAFVPVLEAIESLASEKDGYANYILSKNGDVTGFYKANNKTVAAGKAYLRVDANKAKEGLTIGYADETDGIRLMENGKLAMKNAAIYNLSGQRVNKAQKGIYIVNGKKVVMK